MAGGGDADGGVGMARCGGGGMQTTYQTQDWAPYMFFTLFSSYLCQLDIADAN